MPAKRAEKNGQPVEGYTRISVIIPIELDRRLEVEAAESRTIKSIIVEAALKPYLRARQKRRAS